MWTFDGSGLSGNRLPATRKMSGAGLPEMTSGSVVPNTLWWNSENKSTWLVILSRAISWLELVANANGTLLACKWRINRSAPGGGWSEMGVTVSQLEYESIARIMKSMPTKWNPLSDVSPKNTHTFTYAVDEPSSVFPRLKTNLSANPHFPNAAGPDHQIAP